MTTPTLPPPSSCQHAGGRGRRLPAGPLNLPEDQASLGLEGLGSGGGSVPARPGVQLWSPAPRARNSVTEAGACYLGVKTWGVQVQLPPSSPTISCGVRDPEVTPAVPCPPPGSSWTLYLPLETSCHPQPVRVRHSSGSPPSLAVPGPRGPLPAPADSHSLSSPHLSLATPNGGSCPTCHAWPAPGPTLGWQG